MRVAVVQLSIEPRRRTASLQAALAAVDRASRTDPAPDLIVLPAFCDVPAILSGEARTGEYLQGPTVAALSNRARQWGVFICSGVARRGQDARPGLATVLLDRDGDVLADHLAVGLGGGALECFSAGDGYACVQCLLGKIVPATGPDLTDDDLWKAAAGADLVVAPSCFLQTPQHQIPSGDKMAAVIQGRVKAAGAGCVVADILATEPGGRFSADGLSMIVDRSGALLAGASPTQGEIIWADLQ